MDADLMLVGEAPGKSEELEGSPFVGRSGEFLDDVFEILDIQRENLRLTNAVMCRPTEEDNPNRNREPTDPEIKECKERLLQEIYHVDPIVIVAMGSWACRALLGNTKMSSVRGEMTHFSIPSREKGKLDYTVLVTWHPSYVLRKLDSRTNEYPPIKGGHHLATGRHPYYQFVWSLIRAQATIDFQRALYYGEPITDFMAEFVRYVV